MPRPRPVYRVLVSFGGRKVPREYTFQAPGARYAMALALQRARADRLARPHGIEAVVHLCDLDRAARRKGRAA